MPTERRKNPRLGLAIPTRIQGFLADGSFWDEMTTTLDVSPGGACFPLVHEAELGQVLLMTLALPKRLRQHDLTDASYRVYTLVRGVRRRTDQRRVGVMFFGKYPPRGFHERPAARYLLPSDSIVNAPAPQGLRAGETPYEGVPAAPADGPPRGPAARHPGRRRWQPAPARAGGLRLALHAAGDDGAVHDPEVARRRAAAAHRAPAAPSSSRRARFRRTGAARRAPTCSSTSRSSSSTSGASCCRKSSRWPTTWAAAARA